MHIRSAHVYNFHLNSLSPSKKANKEFGLSRWSYKNYSNSLANQLDIHLILAY
jgi:hypothetical protein